jgi:hypothetical protein
VITGAITAIDRTPPELTGYILSDELRCDYASFMLSAFATGHDDYTQSRIDDDTFIIVGFSGFDGYTDHPLIQNFVLNSDEYSMTKELQFMHNWE